MPPRCTRARHFPRKRRLLPFVLIVLACACRYARAATPTEEELIATGLPLVTIETVESIWPAYEEADAPDGCLGASIRNAVKIPGRITIRTAEGVIFDSGPYIPQRSGMTVNVRGNTSARAHEKKPYKVKLQQAADLLRRGNGRFIDKEWVLLSPWASLKTLLGLQANELMGLQWTPQCEVVNLMMNGDYRGIYILTESVKRNASCRLNVDKQGGYVLELDAYWWNEDLYLPSAVPESLHYTFKYPESDEITIPQLAYIATFVTKAEQSMRDGGYASYIDVDSYARWILCHDILGNTDGGGSNIYITKRDATPASLLTMANLWDFDATLSAAEGRWSSGHHLCHFNWLFASSDETFRRAYVHLWMEQGDTVFARLAAWLDSLSASQQAAAIDRSIARHNARWHTAMPPLGSFCAEAKAYLAKRQATLTDMFNTEFGYITSTYRRRFPAPAGNAAPAAVFTPAGRRTDRLGRGVNILRYPDGTSRKVLVR